MAHKGYNLILFVDYMISACFAFLVFAVGATAVAATGSATNFGPAQQVGNVYADVLIRIEDGARALRADYCARGKVESGTVCGDPDLMLGGPPRVG